MTYWLTRKFVYVPIALAASGIIWIVAEEIRLQLYLNAPCPGPCDKVIGREYGGAILLLITAGVVFGVERIIRPQKAIS